MSVHEVEYFEPIDYPTWCEAFADAIRRIAEADPLARLVHVENANQLLRLYERQRAAWKLEYA